MFKKVARKIKMCLLRSPNSNVGIPLDNSIRHGISIYIDKNCSIGKYTFINSYTVITKASIGKYCSIGSNVSIGQGEHPYDRISTNSLFFENPYEEFTKKDCIIKNDVWIGSYAMINRGVTIGNGAIIGGNSVVTKDVPDYAIVAGAPAKILKFRFTNDIVNELLKMEWWDWPQERIQRNINIFKYPPTLEKLIETKP